MTEARKCDYCGQASVGVGATLATDALNVQPMKLVLCESCLKTAGVVFERFDRWTDQEA
jgi:hypothetical protein